ncbi:class I SAM-dependent methyltransferase [Clostridium oryzae]|uniref:Demethylmenaquinone methyltransferase n=1 Tax=Clostridium oryzae TaxID=1450648 RepID=A0A1V4IWK0_9CLOT|nr:class I SAM-dependent methyltransferase [Clostridium oryzae]OPJ64190.1 demethylmenaquinone methyltransferase [Clostridium oryzae]
MSILEEKFNKISGGRILDVGTGDGYFISVITKLFKDYNEIIGIDNSKDAIQSLKKSNKQQNIQFINMSADKMTFEDNSMDTVCISNTLHHLPNYKQVLSEMLRVLKPNGFFIINEMFCDNQALKQLSHVYIHHLCAEMNMLAGTYHAKTFKRQAIIDIVKETGVKIEDIFEYSTAEEQKADVNEAEEKEILDSCFNSIDNYAEKLKGNKEFDNIKSKISSLKQNLYKVGFMNATELVILGRK